MGEQQEYREKRSLVLSPGESAMLRDSSDGKIVLLTGPKQHSPSSSEEPVKFTKKRGYVPCSMDEAIRNDVIAVQGYYVTLFNPAVTDNHPIAGKTHPDSVKLDVGRKINVPGPVNFALWPGQMAEVIRGHHLRSNQYLVIKINDEEQAGANWTKSIVKKTEAPDDSGDVQTQDGEDDKAIKTPKFTEAPADLAVGKRYIIKGTEVSFYIPPTGVTVEKTENVFIRNAVTLEQIEYCILVDEDGNKRYERGPAVVFPTPTEMFVKIKKKIVHRATELNPISGIHIKVIAPYEENGTKFEEGQELFITGKERAIYFPRKEHALLSYDQNAKHFATAIPTGQGRYMLERMTGEIQTVSGPKMLLPDPRTQVLVRRPLSDDEVSLWYPRNTQEGGEALAYNQSLRELVGSSPTTRRGAVSEGDFQRRSRIRGTPEVKTLGDHAGVEASYTISAPSVEGREEAFSNQVYMEQARHGKQAGAMADEISRGSTYTAPRTIMFGNKYDGVPVVKPHVGYAVQLTNDRGDRRTVVGPATILVDYDETLQVMSLSTGRPKNHDRMVRTVYLRVKNNQVSDQVTVVTRDHVSITVDVSFRVDFEGGNPDKWFEVDNYVKLLVDHVRSVLMGAAKRKTSREMYADGVSFVRDTILGESVVAEDGTRSRRGMFFEENGMRVKDVEVLAVRINDREIGQMLEAEQRETFKNGLDLDRSKRHLEYVQAQEIINRDLASEKHVTEGHQRGIQLATIKDDLGVVLASVAAKVEEHKANRESSEALEAKRSFEHTEMLKRERESADQRVLNSRNEQALTLALIEAETASIIERYKAVDPNFTSALTTLSNNETMKQLAESFNVLKIAGGKDIADVLGNVFRNTPLQAIITRLGLTQDQLPPSNGKQKAPSA